MKIVYDISLMKPGCVLLQASYGCDPLLAHNFATQTWLLAPTPGLRVYEVTESQLEILVERTHTTHKVPVV